ncbi:Uncharacterized protein dnl_15490 [Desulfonema limicola]|uniref:Uncharacterized protein n=1 Tax=Desulfonema limicola TaxID=45656 RepID=A0A975B5Q9_9BACT|nr:hypothetical protein [Desulfonema limicola]QTA79291.1 Uncharacterized protein dnl_15490 [Desulfonema limicola]
MPCLYNGNHAGWQKRSASHRPAVSAWMCHLQSSKELLTLPVLHIPTRLPKEDGNMAFNLASGCNMLYFK